MKRVMAVLLLVGGCQQAEQQKDGAPGQGQVSRDRAGGQAGGGGRIGDLTGLYEGGQAARRNQLCMVANSPTDTRFGLVVWGANQHSCSGSGTVNRSGDRLQLKMTGDETCTIEAYIEGGAVILPGSLPEGCAYYCGARATMNSARFVQVGTGRDQAAKAQDLVGDPLC